MKKKYYKAIILVLASDQTELLKEFKKVYEAYMNANEHITVFFTYGDGTSFIRQSYDLVYDDLKETVMTPWMTTKVIRAMEYIDQNYDYDFLVRSNLSTFWDLDSLIKRLEKYPKEKFFTGRIGGSKDFITGTSMVMTRDIVKNIIENKHLINIKYDRWFAEDKLISYHITKHIGINFTPNKNIAIFEGYTEYNEEKILGDIQKARDIGVDNYRIKNYANQYEKRLELDPKISKLLLKTIYNTSL